MSPGGQNRVSLDTPNSTKPTPSRWFRSPILILEFPTSAPSAAERAELRERMPLKWRPHYKRDRH